MNTLPQTGVPDPARIEELRDKLICELRGLNALRSDAVENAIRAVPRHLFVPEEDADQAYAAEHALVTKRDRDGVALSSVSAARIQAFVGRAPRDGPGIPKPTEVQGGGRASGHR